MEVAMDKDEIITIDGKWGTRGEHAVADIFEEALARVRERGTSEEAIQEHLQNMLGASISRVNPPSRKPSRHTERFSYACNVCREPDTPRITSCPR
jgi:3-methyladenine DNA glycosylase AlkC